MTWAIGLMGLLVLAADDAAKDKSEQAKFKGTWAITATEVNGRKASDDAIKGMTLVFHDDHYAQRVGDDAVEEGSFAIDPEKRPRTIDLKIQTGEEQGKTQRGIYKLEGDTLTLCFASPGNDERPQRFTSEGDSGLMLVTLKRQEP